VTIRQLSQREFAHSRFSSGKSRTVVAEDPPQQPFNKQRPLQWQTAQLPPRPDHTVLNDSTLLFFIGRDPSGFWVARESDGRTGGIFLFKRSAARFARRKSSGGCAIMHVEHTIELDLPNQGSPLVGYIARIIAVMRRRAPLFSEIGRSSDREIAQASFAGCACRPPSRSRCDRKRTAPPGIQSRFEE
jgi:hypothetical protein